MFHIILSLYSNQCNRMYSTSSFTNWRNKTNAVQTSLTTHLCREKVWWLGILGLKHITKMKAPTLEKQDSVLCSISNGSVITTLTSASAVADNGANGAYYISTLTSEHTK